MSGALWIATSYYGSRADRSALVAVMMGYLTWVQWNPVWPEEQRLRLYLFMFLKRVENRL